MKINKKQIVFLSLALAVCIAVYLNWRFLDNVDLGGADIVAAESDQASAEEGKVLGQAQLVQSVAKDVDDYFTECRLDKQQTRDEAIELLKTVAESADSAAETKDKANVDMISIAKSTETEAKIEGLIKAKGFSDCMVYISDGSINVVVASKGLTAEQAAQINEIVIAETQCEASLIKIVEIKSS